MSGTRAGGLKAAQTNLRRRGKDFYREIGRKGGENGHTGGFYNNSALARSAGAKGGRKSRRTNTYVYTATHPERDTVSGSITDVAQALGYSAPTVYKSFKENRRLAGYEITRHEKAWWGRS